MPLADSVFRSSLFQIFVNLFQKTVGVVSTLILARILTPDDFGVVAVLAVSVHFIDILSDAGGRQYLIQKSELSEADTNTAWTLNLLFKGGLALMLVVLAPLVANVLDNAELALAIQVVAISIPLRALENPGMILYAKELNYSPIFKLSVIQKLISFIVVISVAVIDRSYWAIVAGDIAAALALFLLSYVFSSYRPSLTLVKFQLQWGFSQWAVLRGMTGFARSQSDVVIVSKLFQPGLLGSYHLQREIALIPVFSLILPAIEPLLAAIAKAKADPELLRHRVVISFLSLALFLTPVCVFTFMFSESIVGVLLGAQWVDQHRLLAWFSLMLFAFSFNALISDCFIATNRMKLLFLFDLGSTAFIIAILASNLHLGIVDFACLRGWVGLFVTCVLFVVVNIMLGIKTITLVVNLLPSTIALIVTCWVTFTMSSFVLIETELSAIKLVVTGLIFFTCYFLLFITLSVLLKKWLKENSHIIVVLSNSLKSIINQRIMSLDDR